MVPALISTKPKAMLRTLLATSGLSVPFTSEQIYFIADAVKNRSLLGIEVDETNDAIKIYFKDNGNTLANEVLTLDIEDGSGETAAEEIIAAINGLLKNAQVAKISDNLHSVDGVNGIQIPAFTITNSDTTITATATDDFGFSLTSAKNGTNYSATLSMDDDSHSFTKTGTVSNVVESILFDSTDFSAGAATISVTLTTPTQSGVSRTVSQAATIQ